MSRFATYLETVPEVLGRTVSRRFTTMRVPVKLCRGHVVNALAVYGRIYGHTDVTDFTQAQVHRCVTSMLARWGTGVISGILPDQVRETARAAAIGEDDHRWAEAQIARFWPESKEDL